MNKAIQIAYNEFFKIKCKIASEAGFDSIAINFHDMENRLDVTWKEATEKILKILNDCGLKCVQTHLPYYDLRISAEILQDEMESAIREAIRVSGEIGAPWCVYHPRSAVDLGFTSAKALEINKRVISDYIECAVKSNTGIALENLPIFQIVPVKPYYTSDYNDLCELSDSFQSEYVGICWDTGHANMMYFDQGQAIRFLGDRIKCTHIHNNNKSQDLHLLPDSGNIEWNKVMEAFKSIHYSGPLTLETRCSYNDEVLWKSFAQHGYGCLRYLEKLI